MTTTLMSRGRGGGKGGTEDSHPHVRNPPPAGWQSRLSCWMGTGQQSARLSRSRSAALWVKEWSRIVLAVVDG